MEKHERDTFGAIVTSQSNQTLKEILIVRADSESNARRLIDECAKKTGWQSDGHVYLVMEYPKNVPVANQAQPTQPQDSAIQKPKSQAK